VAQLVKCVTPPSTKQRLSGVRLPVGRKWLTLRQSGERLPERRCFVEGGVTHFTSCATFPQSALRKGGATGKVRHATLNKGLRGVNPRSRPIVLPREWDSTQHAGGGESAVLVPLSAGDLEWQFTQCLLHNSSRCSGCSGPVCGASSSATGAYVNHDLTRKKFVLYRPLSDGAFEGGVAMPSNPGTENRPRSPLTLPSSWNLNAMLGCVRGEGQRVDASMAAQMSVKTPSRLFTDTR